MSSEVAQFGSAFVYRPGRENPDDDKETKRARRFTLDIKCGRKDMSRAADWFFQQWKEGLFRDFFGRDVAIVPAPKHAPVRPGAAWPIRDLVEEMGLRRLGQSCEWLQRREKVVKSAHAPPGRSRHSAMASPRTSSRVSTVSLRVRKARAAKRSQTCWSR